MIKFRVEFVCTRCGGKMWGTMGSYGQCNGRGCGFVWRRSEDWRVFYRSSSGVGFHSHAEFQAEIMGKASQLRSRMTFPEMLHELLELAMAKPPTVRVVEDWPLAEKLIALRWASAELLALEGVAMAPRRRPAFIEESAATA